MNAWDLGTIFGIRIRIHWTFLLLPLYVYFSSLMAGTGVAAAVVSILFVLAVFACVLLHELGHALAARQFGIGTHNITLLPIGGIAALKQIPRNPWQELWIAVAGPLVNVVIASTLLAGLALGSRLLPSLASHFLMQLAIANVVLVVFNMIPAFPMDGGRVLRSILALFLSYDDATGIAVSVGKLVAVAFGLFGLFSGNLMLMLVAAFVYFAAQSELSRILRYPSSQYTPPGWGNKTQETSGRRGAGIWFQDPPTQTECLQVPSTLPIQSVANWLAERRGDVCSVIESGKVQGQVTRANLVQACAQGLGRLPIGQLLGSRQ